MYVNYAGPGPLGNAFYSGGGSMGRSYAGGAGGGIPGVGGGGYGAGGGLGAGIVTHGGGGGFGRGVFIEPTPGCCVDGPETQCGGCLKSSGNTITTTDRPYVGPGNGGYNVIPSYGVVGWNYPDVGEGAGSYSKDMMVMPYGSGVKPCCCDAEDGEQDSRYHYVHLLAIPSIVLLIVCLKNATNANQFFPHAPLRSAWWPWSTCFEPVNPYDYCSQFFFDEYTFTHFSHGFVLWFWLIAVPLRWLLNRPCIRPHCICAPGSSFDWLGFYVSAMVEIIWEMFENTPATIEAFRQSGPNSADYAGDSGVNILGDLFACQIGFAIMDWLFLRLKCKGALAVTVAYAVIMTVVLYYWICDGLILIWINLAWPGTVTCVEAPPESMLANAARSA